MKRVFAPVALLALALLAGCLDDPDTQAAPQATKDPQQAAATMPQWGGEDKPIRPGTSLGGYCTFNFLYYDNVTGAAYIGTAGHCTRDLGERLELPGHGEIATVVFDSDLSDVFPDVDPAVDFTLALLDDEQVANANPRMLGWDGPTGAVTLDELGTGDLVHLHGYGILLGQNDITRDRSGAVIDWDERLYRADMPAVNGDSGSPLLHENGKAFGIVSHYGFGATPPSTDEGPHMPFVFGQLALAGFPHVVLATL